MKEALISPLLKKSSLEPIFKNFRPVSNLSFVSKLVEKVVASQLKKHMMENNLLQKYQSAYRPGHSTETALMKVQNDILCAVDKQRVVLLVLLDLSAAFDTVDHCILLKRLSSSIGISGTALSWLTSYLQKRTQCVVINGVTSANSEMKYGVPQGSVLGPLLFTIYTKPLARILENMG
mgnify:CR=1 FL=1